MRALSIRMAVMAALLVLLGAPTWADLVGTSVTGTLILNGGPKNWFDSANGFVPAGYLNTSPSGPTVTISSTQVEFGFNDGTYNQDTADFTGSQLILTDVTSSEGSLPATYTFTDTAFSGLTLSTVSNTFGSGI